ncbi:unnamed protein product [Meloidogyne enterolobii]|uniref:Uncharacterized protein n=1 Tax=Meloidogyne enterolobii TaxID=390850 RepID=A0ACB1A419_MELEN
MIFSISVQIFIYWYPYIFGNSIYFYSSAFFSNSTIKIVKIRVSSIRNEVNIFSPSFHKIKMVNFSLAFDVC